MRIDYDSLDEERKLFLHFLYERDALSEFLQNVSGSFNIKHESTVVLIDRGFCWRDTPQGHGYWSGLQQEWSAYLRMVRDGDY